jgi:uncharacterized coiled-coil protein SlyX
MTRYAISDEKSINKVCTDPGPQRLLQVASTLQELDCATDGLEAQLNKLCNRLAAVLSEVPKDCSETCNPPDQFSPLAQAIHNQAMRVNRMAKDMEALLSRMEI